MDVLEWLEQWYASQCNEDWEHTYGVKIETVDNPGWVVEIDLEGTELEDVVIQYKLVEGSETRIDVRGMAQITDWYGYSVKDKKFTGSGDPTKLRFLLEEFRRLAQQHVAR